MKLGAIIGGVAVLVGAAGGTLWYSNQPIVEKYPNETVKSITERQFFKRTGKYEIFAQDGTKTQEYTLIDGARNGKGKIFFKDGTVEVNYKNGKLNGPVNLISSKYGKYMKGVNINIENSKFDVTSGVSYNVNGSIACSEDDFTNNMQYFLSAQDYNSFKNFVGCLSVENAVINSGGGKCVYDGMYKYPNFAKDSKIVCEESNEEFLSSYAQSFNTISNLSSSLTQDEDMPAIKGGDIGKIKSVQFDSEFKIADKKLKFAINTVSDKVTMVQNGSFGGFEQVTASLVEFAFSPKEDGDGKKLLVSALRNLSWSDWSAALNGHKRFTVTGDFSIVKGFSDPYIMSYYNNNEVTTQWKFDAKGTQLTSKYPNTTKPMLAFGISVSEEFKKTYTSLVENAINIISADSTSFNPMDFMELQKDGESLLQGISSISGVVMNPNGEKTISGVMAMQKSISFSDLMLSPIQYMDFKIVLYKAGKPYKIYDGNFLRGFKMNGKRLSNEEFEIEMQGITKVLQDSVDNIVAELDKIYGKINPNKLNWIDADIDPFLYGFYRGYGMAKNQFSMMEAAENEEYGTAELLSMTAINIQNTFAGNYEGLNNDKAVVAGVVPSPSFNDKLELINSYGGKMMINEDKKNTGGTLGEAFVLSTSNIPSEECIKFLSEDRYILPQNGIVGIAVGRSSMIQQALVDLGRVTVDGPDNAGNDNLLKKYFAVKASSLENILTEENIEKICSDGEKGSFIAVKYY